MGLEAEGKKIVTKPGPGKGKGLMTGPDQSAKNVLVLLCEDSKYALDQLLSS